jgi:hypothetical protein
MRGKKENKKKMTLINGPYNGREIEDAGTVEIRMGIRDGDMVGHALYEPSVDRRLAFFEGNTWLGKIAGEVG